MTMFLKMKRGEMNSVELIYPLQQKLVLLQREIVSFTADLNDMLA